MKKFLSLVLALVMTMSLVTVGAGATEYKNLTDKSEIQYEEAVAVLNKLGIVTGYEDGSFKPTGALTRGAAAKIIVSLMIGSESASNLTVAAAPYKDVPVTNTFAAVISYCKTAGYINGYADGTFRPTAALTGYAFAKMLLGAAGYRGDVEGFTGSGWTMNVAKLGNQAGLFDDFAPAFSGNAGVDRQSACLLALNTLKATEVEYTANGNNLSVNDKGNIVGATTNYTRSYVTSRNDNINQNISKETSGNASNYYTLEFGEEHFPDLKLTADGTAADDFGRPSNQWSYKNAKIGTYAQKADYKYTTEANGDTNADKVKDMGLKDYKVSKSYYYLNGAEMKFKATTDAGKLEEIAGKTANGVLVEAYMDDKNADTINTFVMVETQVMQINAVRSSEVTLKTANTDKNGVLQTSVNSIKDSDDAWSSVKDLKTDDYVLVVPVKDGSSYRAFSVAVPQTVTGKMTNIKVNTKNDTVKAVTVGGTAYSMSALWNSEDNDLQSTTTLSSTVDTTVYLDSYGYVIYAKDVTASNSAIIIDEIYSSVVDGKIVKYAKGWDSNGNALELNLGTSPAYPVSKNDDAAQQGMVYEYETATANNAEYKLVAPATTYTSDATNQPLVYSYGSTQTIKNGQYQGIIVAGGTTKAFDAAVKFIFVSKDDGDVTGITVKEGVSEVTTASKLTYILNKDHNKIVAVVVPNDDDAGNTANLLFFQKVTNHINNTEGKKVAIFTAYVNGEKLTDLQLNKDVTNDSFNNKFYTYSKNESTGVYSLTAYTKYSNKITTVTNALDQVSGADLTGYTNYYFKSANGNILNAKNATVIDLYTDDGITYNSVKEMKDAIGKDVNADNGAKITGFNVAYIYNNDSGNSGFNTVAYLFIVGDLTGGTTGGDISGTADVKYENIAVLGNGKISYTQTITRPEYYAANTTVKVKADLYVDGAYYGPLTEETFTGTATTVNKVYGAVGEFTGVSKVEMKNITITPNEVNVRFIDGDTGNTLTRVTTSTPTVTTGAAQAIDFTVGTSNGTKTLQYAVSGVVVPSGVTLDKHTVEAIDSAPQTVTNSAGTATTTWEAKGDSYVTITVYGLKALEATEKFDITSNVSALALTPDNFSGGVTGETVTLTVTGTPADSISNGTNAIVTMAASADTFVKAYNYAVTLKINGQTITHELDTTTGATKPVSFLVTNITSNLEINKADITVVATPKLAVTSATWTATTVTLTFNQNVDKTTGEDIAVASPNYAWGKGSETNTSVLSLAQVSGNTVTLTFTGDALKVGNTITLTADILTDLVAANVNTTTGALTLAADGKVTL